MKKIILLLLISLFPSGVFAAANLAMSSATLSADGATLTIPFTGTCQTPLSPASGILGFSINLTGGWVGSISTATRSGCTVTLVLSEPISKDEIPTVTLASTTGANFLTDNSGNTPTGQSGFTITNSSEWLETSPASGTLTNKYQAEGMGLVGTPNFDTNYGFQTNFPSADACYRINATATQIDLWAYQGTDHWVLRQDGVQIHDWGQTADINAFAKMGLVTGISGAHEYDFCQINPQIAPYLNILARIRVTGTIGAQPTVKTLLFAAGDSITALYGPTPVTDSTLGDISQVATKFGYADQFWGSPGDQLCSSMNTQIPTQLAYITTPIPVLTVAGSTDYNDHSMGTTATAVGVCMDTLLTNIDNLSNPPTHVIVLGNLPFAAGNIPGTYDTALAAATASHPRACFVSRLNWINTAAFNGTTGDRQSDQIHIQGGDTSIPVGYYKIANNEKMIVAGFLNGSSFTVTGPSGGRIGAASTNFTIAPSASGLTFNGEPIALSDGGAGGTFTPNITTLTSGASSITFTYTPAIMGVISLSYSGLSGCWTAPSANSYTSTSSSASSSYTGGKTSLFGNLKLQ